MSITLVSAMTRHFGSASTFTVDIGPSAWPKGEQPAPGDLLVLVVVSPSPPVTGPAGWSVAPPDGRTFWTIFSPRDPTTATFHAPSVIKWLVERYFARSSGMPFGGPHDPGSALTSVTNGTVA